MSDRDELAADIRRTPPYHCIDCIDEGEPIDVDDLWAAGWRKKPSREAVQKILDNTFGAYAKCGVAADAILALMDGGSDDR